MKRIVNDDSISFLRINIGFHLEGKTQQLSGKEIIIITCSGPSFLYLASIARAVSGRHSAFKKKFYHIFRGVQDLSSRIPFSLLLDLLV